MSAFLEIMFWPFLACLVLTGIHAYLGFHVIERQVIFVDLALAQIAALGASIGIIFNYHFDSPQSYWLSLGFTVVGAFIFSVTRFELKNQANSKQSIPQEAIIGITFAVSAALLVLVLSRSGEGDEHIRQALVGNILLVTPGEVMKILIIYILIGALHFLLRDKFFLISQNPQEAFAKGLNVKFWDFLFYVSFGFVVTSSVKIAGVLLVFSFLVVPPVCAMLFSSDLRTRLALGWIVGFLASVLGMTVSYYLDFPTGASVVCTFGVIFSVLAAVRKCFN